MIVGAMIVGAIIVGAMIVGATIVWAMRLSPKIGTKIQAVIYMCWYPYAL